MAGVPAIVPLGEASTIAEAQYLAFTAALAAVVSQVRQCGAQAAAIACDIWTDCHELVVKMSEGVGQGESEMYDAYTLAQEYLRQFAATRLRRHPPVYSRLYLEV